MAAAQPSTSRWGRQLEDNVLTYLWGHREQPCWSQALGDPGVHTPGLPQSWGWAELTLCSACSLFHPASATGLVAPHSVKMTRGWVTPAAPGSSFSRLPLHLCAGAHALTHAFTHLHTLIHKLTLRLAHMLTHFSKLT